MSGDSTTGLDPAGAVVAVTGVTSGIGRGIATVLAGAGAHVVGNGRRADLGDDLARKLADAPGSFRFVAGDMTSRSDAAELVRTAVAAHGRLDVLVNNAGTVGDRPLRGIDEIDEAFWEQLIGANLTSTFNGCRAALAALRSSGGVIVNVGSGAGDSVGPDLLAYRAAKAGVMHLSRCLAELVAPDGVRVHTLMMHAVETPGGERVMAHRASTMTRDAEDAMRSARQRVAVTPDDVGRGIVALLRDPTLTTGPGFEVR